MDVSVLKPIGFCNGVNNTISLLDKTIFNNPNSNIYIIGSIIHNENIINEYIRKGIKFIDIDENIYTNIDKLDESDLVFFSAHGHDKKIEYKLLEKRISFIDSTCFNISKYHTLINYYKNNYQIIYIGNINHDETKAFINNPKIKIIDINNIDFNNIINISSLVLAQSTISLDLFNNIINKLKKKIDDLTIYDSICNVYKQRLEAIKLLNNKYNNIIVIGSKNSSNATKLYEYALTYNKLSKVYFINNVNEIKNITLSGNVIITSSTSSDDNTINDIVSYLESL